jgi:hypothetical protein
MDSGRIMKELREMQEGVKNVSSILFTCPIYSQHIHTLYSHSILFSAKRGICKD